MKVHYQNPSVSASRLNENILMRLANSYEFVQFHSYVFVQSAFVPKTIRLDVKLHAYAFFKKSYVFVQITLANL